GAPIASTAAGASAAVPTTRPGGTAMPWARRNAFASGSVKTLRRCARAVATSVAKSVGGCIDSKRRTSRAGGSMVDTQDHLTELLCRFEIPMGIRCFPQRENPIDHGLQLAAAQKRHHHLEIMLSGAVRADNLQFLVEDVVHWNSTIVGLGSADGHDAAAAREAADRLFQEIAADVLDHEVDAAFFGAFENFVDEVDVVVIDPLIGTELLCTLEFPIGARRGVDIRTRQLADLDGRHAHPRA